MKFLFTILFSMLSLQGWAVTGPVFVRVYNSAGKKIGKGYVCQLTDSSLQLSSKPGKASILEIPFTAIGVIKPHHAWVGYITGYILIRIIGIVGLLIVFAILFADIFSRPRGGGNIFGGNMQDTTTPPKKRKSKESTSAYTIAGCCKATPAPNFKPVRQYSIKGEAGNWKAFCRAFLGRWN